MQEMCVCSAMGKTVVRHRSSAAAAPQMSLPHSCVENTAFVHTEQKKTFLFVFEMDSL